MIEALASGLAGYADPSEVQAELLVYAGLIEIHSIVVEVHGPGGGLQLMLGAGCECHAWPSDVGEECVVITVYDECRDAPAFVRVLKPAGEVAWS